MIQLSSRVGLFLLAALSLICDFKRLHTVEAYEVQPGIIVTPIYGGSGNVCKLVVEKRHYSAGTIDLDAEMSRGQIDQILDQLVSENERGKKILMGGLEELSITDGLAHTTTVDYEKISLDMEG